MVHTTSAPTCSGYLQETARVRTETFFRCCPKMSVLEILVHDRHAVPGVPYLSGCQLVYIIDLCHCLFGVASYYLNDVTDDVKAVLNLN